MHTKLQDVSLLLLRLIVAAVFLYAGTAKWALWSMEPSEQMSAGMLTLLKFLSVVEPIGAVAVILGFLTRWAAAGFSLIMIGAMVLKGAMMGIALFTSPAGTGWDYDLLIFGGSVVLAAFGAGRWSADRMMGKA